MAVLSALDRARTAAQWMRGQFGAVAFTKTDLQAAVAAADDWADANQAAYNAALPVAFRTNATLIQKTILLAYVIMRRAGLLRADEDG